VPVVTVARVADSAGSWEPWEPGRNVTSRSCRGRRRLVVRLMAAVSLAYAEGVAELDPQVIEQAMRSMEFARAAVEQARRAAEHADSKATEQERLAACSSNPSRAALHARMAAMHRRSEACQRTAERLHSRFWRRLQRWMARADAGSLLRPVFMSAVASTAGWDGAVLTVCNGAGVETLVAASDDCARQSHEIDVAVGEGPSWEALRGRASQAGGAVFERRWPRFGAAAACLGVHAAAGVPLGRSGSGLRASLTVVGATEPSFAGSVSLREMGEALTGTVLCAHLVERAGDADPPGLGLFEDEDFLPALHQAAGALHERCGWDADDAVALLRAHAFAEDRPLAEVAVEVLRGVSPLL